MYADKEYGLYHDLSAGLTSDLFVLYIALCNEIYSGHVCAAHTQSIAFKIAQERTFLYPSLCMYNCTLILPQTNPVASVHISHARAGVRTIRRLAYYATHL